MLVELKLEMRDMKSPLRNIKEALNDLRSSSALENVDLVNETSMNLPLKSLAELEELEDLSHDSTASLYYSPIYFDSYVRSL